MSAKYLGNTFDIHTGGIDHIPVHHNNEIAQSESAHNGSPLAHYWLHNAFVNSDGKMSKSKGEFTRLVTLIEKGILPVEYRYWLLQARYSSQLQYTEEAVRAAASGYKNLISHISKLLPSVSREKAEDTGDLNVLDENWNKILVLINDDLNTPLCISKLWDILKDDSINDQTKIELVTKADTLLGLDLVKNAQKYIDSEKAAMVSLDEIPAIVKDLVEKRKTARQNKEWSTSDSLREEIRSLGFEVLDSESGQTLRKI
jgi:cysteinyl-tRNA synthetase